MNIDVIHKKLQKINAISFENNSELKGISDGYTTNKQGSKIPLYDKNIALSTVFAYEYQHKIDSIRRDLNSEIEKRKYADELLNNRVDGVEADIESLDNEVNVLKTTIATMDSQIKSLETELSSANDKISALDSEVNTLNTTVSTMDSYIKSLESTLAAAISRIEHLESLTKHFVQ